MNKPIGPRVRLNFPGKPVGPSAPLGNSGQPRPPGIRLSKLHETWVTAISLAVFISGVLWLLWHYCLAVQGPFGSEPHPLEAWCLKFHGATAMAFLVLLGTLIPGHIHRNWRMRRNLLSGIFLLIPLAFLVLSGYGLYYAGGEGFRAFLVISHWGVGLASFIPFFLHVMLGKKRGY